MAVPTPSSRPGLPPRARGRPRSSSRWCCRWSCSDARGPAGRAGRARPGRGDPRGARGGPGRERRPATRARGRAHRVLARAEVHVGVAARRSASRSRVEVTYHDRTDLPLVGALFPDPDLHASRDDAGRTVMRTSAARWRSSRSSRSSRWRSRSAFGVARLGHAASDRARADTAADAAALAAAACALAAAVGPRARRPPRPRRATARGSCAATCGGTDADGRGPRGRRDRPGPGRGPLRVLRHPTTAEPADRDPEASWYRRSVRRSWVLAAAVVIVVGLAAVCSNDAVNEGGRAIARPRRGRTAPSWISAAPAWWPPTSRGSTSAAPTSPTPTCATRIWPGPTSRGPTWPGPTSPAPRCGTPTSPGLHVRHQPHRRERHGGEPDRRHVCNVVEPDGSSPGFVLSASGATDAVWRNRGDDGRRRVERRREHRLLPVRQAEAVHQRRHR